MNRVKNIFSRKITLVLSFLFVSATYCSIAWNSIGYDDEFFNIRCVREFTLGQMVSYLQQQDLHPPLSYIINYSLFRVLGNWSLVRLCSPVFFLSALFYLINQTPKRAEQWGLLLLLGLNPTIMLWATGLRWYAYMLPILLLLTAMPRPEKKYYWAWFFGWMLVGSYIGYAGLFLMLPYFICYWVADKTPFVQKCMRILPWAFCFILLYSYQAYVLVTVHSKMDMTQSANQQVFSGRSTLIAFVSSMFANQGLFPLSPFGIISMLGSLVLFLVVILDYRNTKRQSHWLVFLLGSAFFFVTGLGGKIRNLMLLEPAKNSLFAKLIDQPSRWVVAGFVLLVVGNLAGVYNVLTHQNTTKNAWNLPVTKTLDFLLAQRDSTAAEYYFTYHPSYTYYLMDRKENVISLYSGLYFDSSYIHHSVSQLDHDTVRKNFIFLFTYRGRSMEPDHYAALRKSIRTIDCDSSTHHLLDRDTEYNLKLRYFPDYPEYQTEVYKLYNVKKPFNSLLIWEQNHLRP